jgi:hypothetical protein
MKQIHQHIQDHLRRYRRLVIVAASVSAIAVAGLAAGGTAQAAVGSPSHAAASDARARTLAPDVEYSCSGTPGTSSRNCYFQTQNGDAPLFSPSGILLTALPPNDKIHVTCYYQGDSPSGWLNDGVQDHVVWTQETGTTAGHIPDPYVDEGGENPWNSPYDLTECPS